MTIGKTGNRIVDRLAKDKARNQAEERKAVESAKKAGRRGKGGKFRGAGKAGRAAARRPAKGISAKYIGKAGSAGKVVNYGLKEGAELIASNCGFDIPTISAGLAPRLRKDIQKQIVRMSFSTPSTSGKATSNKWRDRVDFIRSKLGIDDSFSYCASRHTDAEHDHIHLDFNRVSDVGELWSDSLIGLRLAKLEQQIEHKFALKLTRREDFVTHGNINKKSVERAQRLQEQPAFSVIQTAIKAAAQGKPDVLTFIQRMADCGIAVRPNLKQFELNGFGYRYGYQKFTGKQLGLNWTELKEMVIYEPNEHLEILADIKREIDAGTARPDSAGFGTSTEIRVTNGEQASVERSSSAEGDKNRDAKPKSQKFNSGNREIPESSTHLSASYILAGLHRRLADRRARFIRLSERLKAEYEGNAIAERFRAALDPAMTDSEVAQLFLKKEFGSAAARSLVEVHLVLSKDELRAVLLPYQAVIKTEEEHAKRMAEAERQSTAPTTKPSVGDLPSM